MAVAVKEGRPIHGAEAAAERPDGKRIPFLAYPRPLRDRSGALTGAVNTLIDITERKRSEEFEKRLASIVESSDDAIVSKDLDGIIRTWNAGAKRLFGYTAEEAIGKPILLLIPMDRHGEESDILSRIRRGECIDHYETVRQRKDGSLVEISVSVSPIKNAEGRVIGASKIARDITARRRAQEQQNLLIREMSHRVKNLFAVTSGLVTLSARSARTPADMAETVRDRLGALRALTVYATRPDQRERETVPGHDLARSRPNDLRSLRRPGAQQRPRVLHHHRALSADQRERRHEHCSFLHELATNAGKYGALSSPGGYIHIDWSVKNDELLLTWKEHGGPCLDGPAEHEGFGSSLVRRLVTGQFGGQLSYDWKAKGLIIRLSMPVERLAM